MSDPSGYSGKPLYEKLGLKPGVSAWFGHECSLPRFDYFLELPFEIDRRETLSSPLAFAHAFVDRCATLSNVTERVLSALDKNGTFWVSWPKKASRIPTDITEDHIRELLLPLGLVDVKVCAVNETWSGLKMVWRKELR